MTAKNVKIPSPSKPHLHFWKGYWRLEPPLSGRQCDSVSDWEQAHFFRHRLNNAINAAKLGRHGIHPRPRDWVGDTLAAYEGTGRPLRTTTSRGGHWQLHPVTGEPICRIKEPDTDSNWIADAHRIEEQMRPPKQPSIWPFALSSLIGLAVFMTIVAYITQ